MASNRTINESSGDEETNDDDDVSEDPPKRGEIIFWNDFDNMEQIEQNWIQETGGHGWGNNELQLSIQSKKYHDYNYVIKTFFDS